MRIFKSEMLLFCLVSFVFATNAAYAAGYAILEQSSEGVGNAYAGAVAGYGDGSEVAFNPAAMAWIEDAQVSFSEHLIIPHSEFSNRGSTLGGTMPLSGDNGPDGGETVLVPSLYAVYPLNEKIHLGIGVNSPFGLATEYDREWVGRYHGVKTELLTINVKPAVSIKLDERFSVGAGLNIVYADAEISNAVDFGTIGVARLGLPTATALGLAPQANDGFAVVKGDDWEVGYNFGASYTYCDENKIGISWHSKIGVELDGEGLFDVPAAALPLTATGLFTDTPGTAAITLPDHAALGWYHRLNDKWALLGEAEWTHWSRFEELRVRFEGPQPDSVVDESWSNSWRYSAALNYYPIDKLTLKAGFTYDQSPIAEEHRTPRIPGNNRKWLAIGASYEFNEDLRADLNYAHLFVSDAKTNIVDATGHNLVGDWDLSVDIVSLGLSWAF